MNAKNRTVAWAATMLAAGIILAGCSKSQPPAESSATRPPKTEAPAQPPATAPAPPETKPEPEAAAATAAKTPAESAHNYVKELLSPAKLKEKAPETYKVKFDTTRGEFTITVTRAWAPLEADRFYNLVKHHFYDNAAFFRVVPNFVVQFGISANPAVNSAWEHVTMKDDPPAQTNKRGTITFAQTGNPNSRGTQVFINLKDNARLDRMAQGFAPFGVVDGNGMNVVEMMYDGYGDSAGPDQDQLQKQGDPYLRKGWPKLDHIKSATLVGATATAR
jgi:peptidyl-prolyl cis-trans isomerase A (cyclophilin A)